MEENSLVKKYEAFKAARLLNFLIDIICSFLFLIITTFVFIIICYVIHSDLLILIDNENFMEIFSMISYVFCCFLIESFTKGRSVGKYITGTKVVMIDGSQPSKAVFFRRNLYRLIPLDVFSFLFGKGFHDRISKTRVVMKNDFERELNTK